MKCRCGRTMGWRLTGPLNRPQEHDRRAYHCPGCSQSSQDCTCPQQRWRLEDMIKPGFNPFAFPEKKQ